MNVPVVQRRVLALPFLVPSAPLILIASMLSANAGLAQDTAEPSSEPTTATSPTPEPAPAVAPSVDPAPSVATDTTEAASESSEAAPAAAPAAPFEPKLTIGVGLRTGLALTLDGNGVDDPQLSLNDGLVDQVHIRPFMSGALTDHIGFFVQFEVGTPKGLGSFAILDGMAQIKFVDEAQLWIGQHIPANDRNNMNGPFFGNTWNFAINVPSYSFDVGARDRGATLWGLIGGGILKYHLSLVDLQPGQELSHARIAGRVTVNLLDPENYYYASGTYWGSQDTLAIGAVFQHQSGVDVAPDPADPTAPIKDDNDFTGFSLDAFFEKVLSAGVITVEGGYWNFENVGADYVTNQGTVDSGIGIVGPLPGSAYMGVLSYLTPKKIGPGQVQVNARLQVGQYDGADTLTFDGGLAYVIDGFNHKYHFNYRHQDVDSAGTGTDYNVEAIQLGVQYMMSR